MWELKGFKRIRLARGEEKKVVFVIAARSMAMIDNEGKCIVEPGFFEVYMGGSQPDPRSSFLTGYDVKKAVFEVTGKPVEMEY